MKGATVWVTVLGANWLIYNELVECLVFDRNPDSPVTDIGNSEYMGTDPGRCSDVGMAAFGIYLLISFSLSVN